MSAHQLLGTFGLALLAALPTSAHAIDLEVGQIVVGRSAQFTVGGATPGQTVYVAASRAAGNGPCPPALSGVCLDIVSPILVASGTADPAGRVVLPRNVPAGTSVGDYVFQVVQGGAQPASSVVVRAPVLQVLGSPMTVRDLATYDQALYTLQGDLTFASGNYPASIVLPYLERGAVAITRLDLDDLTLPAWLEGSLLVGPASGVPSDPAPRAGVHAPQVGRLTDLDAWAWDVTAFDLPALAEVGAIRFQVAGPAGRPVTLDFPSLESVSGGSVRGLSGLSFESLSGREVTVSFGRFEGVRFYGSWADLVLRGNLRVSAPALRTLPGFLTMDGVSYQFPWIDAPALSQVGSDLGAGGVSVRTTGWTTLDGLLPGLASTALLEVADNPYLTDMGRVGSESMSVDTVNVYGNDSLTGWAPDETWVVGEVLIAQ